MARNRIIYASQSVWCNGEVLYRVQSLGSTTTFTSEDIFELGHLDIIDVVDDVPAVAVTLNTNDFGDLRTLATLAQLAPAKRDMDATAIDATANLIVVSGTNLVETSTFLHGVAIADFAIVCGNLPGISIWAPVQDECSLGTLADNIDQTLFLDEVFVNSLEFSYTTGANATENYGAETDNKMWLLNDGRFVNWDAYTLDVTDISNGYVDLTLTSGISVAVLSAGGASGFLRETEDGAPGVTWYNTADDEVMNVEIATTNVDTATYWFDEVAGGITRVYFPTTGIHQPAADDRLEVLYSANGYGTASTSKYFTALEDIDRPDMIGALRQGQVEVYIVSPTDLSYDNAWRLTGCTISADLTREALSELGHLSPYDRPLTLPVPITVTVDTTAGDLENWSKFADKLTEFDNDTLDDIDLTDLMKSEDLVLVVKVFGQTDEEAGGTGANRKIFTGSPLVDKTYMLDGVESTYSVTDREYALKTVIVEHLKITDEGATLDMGANMTQTFGFRSTNDLFVIKGDISIGNITDGYKVRRNG